MPSLSVPGELPVAVLPGAVVGLLSGVAPLVRLQVGALRINLDKQALQLM
jgi:hypothetical protein